MKPVQTSLVAIIALMALSLNVATTQAKVKGCYDGPEFTKVKNRIKGNISNFDRLAAQDGIVLTPAQKREALTGSRTPIKALTGEQEKKVRVKKIAITENKIKMYRMMLPQSKKKDAELMREMIKYNEEALTYFKKGCPIHNTNDD